MARRDQGQIPSLEYFQNMAQSDDELQRNLGQYWTTRLDSGLPPLQAMPWEIGLLQLSPDHHIAYLGGEVLAEWLGHLRTWFNDERLLVWGYCQDVPCYLPTDELIPEGGYEVNPSNMYGKEGPGPFEPSLNKAVRLGFTTLARHLV
jgi:neutral ceramidase